MSVSEIYKELLKDYDILASISKEKMKAKRENCYEKCPRIREIDEELNLTGIRITKAIIQANSEEREKYVKEIKENTQKLEREKKLLLRENGFLGKYFEDLYKCNKCKDTGFKNNVKCECFKQNLIKKYYDLYALSNNFDEQNFSKFDIDYYSDVVCEEYNMSPRENMKRIGAKCSMFIDDFETSYKNMLFSGSEGIGKTFLCNCIAKALIDKGKSVIYTTAFDLFECVKKERFDENFKGVELSKAALEVDLLVIDDLGTEIVNTLSTTILFNIINKRLVTKKSTLISTNLDAEELRISYTNRNLSRLYGEYDVLKFFGDDIRMHKRI